MTCWRAGLAEDGVRLVRYADRWPLPGTRAERRAVRGVFAWFGLSAAFGIACIVLYLVWPFRYPAPGYELYTPLLGVTGGGCVLLLAVAIIRYAKNFLPEEQAVQQRHDDPSGDFDRSTTSALITDTVRRGGMPRRRAVLGMAGVGVGIPVVGALIAAVGGPDQGSLAAAARDGHRVAHRLVLRGRPEGVPASGCRRPAQGGAGAARGHGGRLAADGVSRSGSPTGRIPTGCRRSSSAATPRRC
ncbi:hypothetical protein [Kutzneria kofuensis]|uniref:hypothetical protein n=1 Tax=Kutzneria kofuensis TaxID=103725 RepID=UPI0031E87798